MVALIILLFIPMIITELNKLSASYNHKISRIQQELDQLIKESSFTSGRIAQTEEMKAEKNDNKT